MPNLESHKCFICGRDKIAAYKTRDNGEVDEVFYFCRYHSYLIHRDPESLKKFKDRYLSIKAQKKQEKELNQKTHVTGIELRTAKKFKPLREKGRELSLNDLEVFKVANNFIEFYNFTDKQVELFTYLCENNPFADGEKPHDQ